MTKNLEWEMAKWVKRHPGTRVADLPKWFALPQKSRFFCRVGASGSLWLDGPSADDTICMKDEHLDAFREERARRIHAFRDWMEPTGVGFATIISLIALVRTF